MNREISFENGDWLFVCNTTKAVQAIVAGLGRHGKPPEAVMSLTRAQAVALHELLGAAIADATALELPQVKIERPGFDVV